jgi:methylenetetrahydrofolate dehydrogenase (NADP+)/methenyltetrahydrofolate cyclohydrolase
MQLLDGKTLSQKILSSLIIPPDTSLHVILVGDDPSSIKYVSIKEKNCQEVGVTCTIHHLSPATSEFELIKLITQLNTDPTVTGFFVQLPLPPKFNKIKILNTIDPKKDVDGLNPSSKFFPAVATGIIRLLDEYHLNSTGKNVVIINDSGLVGQPLKKLFEKRHAIVTLLNDKTSNIKDFTLSADILISATGVKNIVSADMVKEGAVVVDAANGDVEFTSVSPKCSFITPTFGGVGPMTVASLLYNLVQTK